MNAILDSVLVSATRIESPPSETGKSVTIVTSEQIAQLPVASVDELLRLLPGVNMNSRGGFGVQADVGIRGSTFSQVLFLLDNVRINDPLTAHFNNNIPVALSEIDRIEIIRGPASASFGADAVGGVVHIKTKNYTADAPVESLEVAGDISGGSHNLFLADVGASYGEGKVLISASGKASLSDGELLENPNFAAGTTADSTYRTFFDLRTYSGAISWFVNDKWKVYARGGFDTRDFNAKYFYTRSTFDESTEKTTSQWYQAAVTRRGGNSQTQLDAGYRITDDNFAFNPAFPPNVHTTKQLNLTATHSFQFLEKGQLAVGAQLLSQDIESTDRGDNNNFSAGGYAIASWYFTDYLKATGSFRLEYNDNFGIEPVPQLNIAYIRPKLVIRGSAGRSIRAPDFTERFVSSQIPDLTPGRNIGNPDLEAERAWSFDAGADWSHEPGCNVSGTVFYRISSNLIDYTVTNSDDIDNADNLQPGQEYLYATNISDSRVFGIELQWRRRFEFNPRSVLSWMIAYTYLETSNSDDVVSKNISNHPTHNANLMLSYDIGRFQFTATNNFVNRSPEFDEILEAEVPDTYFVTDLKIGVWAMDKSLLLYGKALNIFDVQYSDILGAPMPGQWFAAGVQWKLPAGN